MIAQWTMSQGLTVRGDHHGNPRRWTITAWGQLADGTKERITVRPPSKCTLRDLIPLVNGQLQKFEAEHGVEIIEAGFQAVAR